MSAERITDVDLDQLWEQGKRLILLDVDHTLVQWKGHDFSVEVLAWVAKAKELGFELCIVSNTRRVVRLNTLAEELGVQVVRGRMKPSRSMYLLALARFKMTAEQTIMIGDQLMTDVLGANRAGIDAIWLLKMEGKEFFGTKLNRAVERFLTGAIYKALVVPVDGVESEESRKRPIWERKVFLQFVKFCVVGGTSFIIDSGLRLLLLFKATWNGEMLEQVLGGWLRKSVPVLFQFADSDHAAAFPVIATLAASVAILNSFVWNRMWTFGIRGKEERLAQLRKFVIVSLIGLVLNVAFSTLFNHMIPGDSSTSVALATLFAAILVAIWNFTGQRFWAFKSGGK